MEDRLKLYPIAAQGSLALGIYDDAHDFDKERAEELGRIGMEKTMTLRTKWYDEADEYIRYHMHRTFTADDLVAEIGLPMDLDPNALSNNGVGAYLSHLAHRNPPTLRLIGYQKSSRCSNRGRILRLWRIVGRP